MKKLLITSSIIALTALASCSQVVSPNTKDNDITGLEATYQVTCGDKFEEQGKKVSSTSEDLKFAFYTDEQLTKRYYDIQYDGLVGSINGGTSADYWVKVTAGGGATGYKEVSKVAKITATCEQSDIGIVPTDCIGEKAFACKYCGAKMSSGGLPMEDSDVVLYDGTNFNYGLLNARIRDEEDFSKEPFHLGDLVYACHSDKDKTVEVNLPKINFNIYKDKIILIKFRTNNRPGWGTQYAVHIGTDESGENLFDGTLEDGWDVNAESMFILNYSSETNKLTLKVNSKSFKSVMIDDPEVIKGTKNIVINVKGENRSFAFYNGGVVLNHEHTWEVEETAPTDKIGFKIHECSVCKEREYSDNLMEDSDIKIEAINSYGANAKHYYTSPQEGVWGMTWGHDDPATLNIHEMKFPKVMFKEYSIVAFNYTTNEATSWGSGGEVGVGTSSEECDLISYTNIREQLSGKITATYNASTQELTLTAYDVTAQNGETQLGTKTITISDDIASGSENLSLFLKVNNYRAFGITSVNVETE